MIFRKEISVFSLLVSANTSFDVCICLPQHASARVIDGSCEISELWQTFSLLCLIRTSMVLDVLQSLSHSYVIVCLHLKMDF